MPDQLRVDFCFLSSGTVAIIVVMRTFCANQLAFCQVTIMYLAFAVVLLVLLGASFKQ